MDLETDFDTYSALSMFADLEGLVSLGYIDAHRLFTICVFTRFNNSVEMLASYQMLFVPSTASARNPQPCRE